MKVWGRFVGIALCMAVAMLSLYWECAQAQLRQDGRLPEALTGIQPAGGMCRREDLAMPDGQGTDASRDRADPTCFISARDLASLMAAPDAVLMDLRSPADYRALHAEGAISVHLSDLGIKPYWREKRVLLISNGKAEGELLAECARLKRAGYKDVRVLRGGLPAWRIQGLPVLEQSPTAISQNISLTAEELWLESQNHENVLLLDQGQGHRKEDFPDAIPLREVSVTAVLKVLERYRKEMRRQPPMSVVLITGALSAPEQVESILRAIAPIPLLVYGGTPQQYQQRLKIQKAVWEAQARGPKKLRCGL